MKQRANLRSPLFLQYESRPAEDESENLMLYSEEFSGTNWASANTSLTADLIESPDGTTSGDELERTSTSASYRSCSIGKSASAITYTSSVFIKKGSDNYFSMRAQGTYPSRVDVRFRFDTEQIYYAQASSNFTLDSYGVVGYGNGWYRLHFTYTSDTHTTLSINFSPRSTDGDIDSTDTSNDAFTYVWGAQTEEGSSMSSYIKTEGTTEVRAATTSIQEENVTAELRIYEGAYQTDAPTEPTYSLTKTPENGKTTFEIAELIRDYIEQTTTKTSGTVWADVKLSDNLQLDRHYHFLATEGYIDNTEGLQTHLNAPSSEGFMQSNSTVFIPEGQELEIPIYADNNSYYAHQRDGVERPPTYFSSSDDNSNQIEYVTVESEDDALALYVNSTIVGKISVIRTECSKYANNILMFVNKFGAKQDFFVNMKSTEKFKVKDDGFSRSVVDYSTLSVNNGIHSYKRRVLESKETYTLNTPFLDEENVQVFEELLLSEYVWLKKEGADYIPVIIKDMSMTRKTHLNDKLIQYSVEVESANHLVNIQR